MALRPGEVDDFISRLGPLLNSGQLTGQQATALIDVARRSGNGGFLDPSLSQSIKRSRSGALLRALDRRLVDRQRFSESMQQVIEGGALRSPRARAGQLSAIEGDQPSGGSTPDGSSSRRSGANPTESNAAPGQDEPRRAGTALGPIEPVAPRESPRKDIVVLGGSRPPLGGRQNIPSPEQIEWLDAPETGALRGHKAWNHNGGSMKKVSDSTVRDMVKTLSLGLERGHFAGLATLLSELVDAERAGVISNEWRQEIDVGSAERLFRSRADDLSKTWRDTFEEYRKTVQYDGVFFFEEMVILLTSRDDLQVLPRYMNEDPRDQLEEADALLRKVGENNPEAMWEAREGVAESLGYYLPEHWWWRMQMDAMAKDPEEA